MIKEVLEKLIRKEDLEAEEMRGVVREIIAGGLKESQVAAFLVALRCKGESAGEILGGSLALREKITRVETSRRPLLDTCGTGGDGLNTFNISTVSAFVAAGAGAAVAKHGNRAVSSNCGSADLCAALGVELELTPAQLGRCLDGVGISFLYAPALHPALAHAAPARKALGLRTVFNLLGPLNNPAGADCQLLGVYDPSLTTKMGEVLLALGVKKALVVSGEDGLDEVSPAAPTRVTEIRDGGLRSYTLTPLDFGLPPIPLEQIRGQDADAEAARCLEVLQGRKGPRRGAVLLNAGAALYAAGTAEDMNEGISQAARSIDSGAALEKLQRLVAFTREQAGRPPQKTAEEDRAYA